jgi:hypothetical protein
VKSFCLSLTFLIVSGTLSESEGAAHYTLRICNIGSAPFSVASVDFYPGGLFSSDRYHGYGWWVVKPGDCTNVFAHANHNSTGAYLAFAYVDRSGAFGLTRVTPNRLTGNFRESTAKFCAASVPFRYRNSYLSDARDCPEIGATPPLVDAEGNPMFMMPFPMLFAPTGEGYVTFTFDVSVDPNTPVWLPLPRRDNLNPRATVTAPPAPAAAPPATPVRPAAPATRSGPPKPRQANTFNATLLGNDIVTRDGRTWYYADGSAVARGAEISLDVLDKPAEYTDGLWRQPFFGAFLLLVEHLKALGSKNLKTEAYIWENGRLLVFQAKTNGQSAVQAVHIQALDLQKATFLSSSRLLRVPCAARAPCVYVPIDGTAVMFLDLPVDGEQGRATALAAFRTLRERFNRNNLASKRDSTCKCFVYPGHGGGRFIRSTKTFDLPYERLF